MEKNKKILVIDDDAHITRVLELKLKKQGYEIITAGNGKEGLKLIESDHPQVVITDIVMPEREGLEVITSIRKNFPDMKVIAISGGGGIEAQEYLKYASKLGAHLVFVKPFSCSEILEAVNELVE